jgi:hypothetical protein
MWLHLDMQLQAADMQTHKQSQQCTKTAVLCCAVLRQTPRQLQSMR